MADRSSSFVWFGPIFDVTGYADEGRGLVRGLHDANVPLVLRTPTKEHPHFRAGMSPEDRAVFEGLQQVRMAPPLVLLQHYAAGGTAAMPDAAINVCRTMFETDSLPPDWVHHCNDMDELWVPSQFNVESFRHAGVRSPIYVVPGAIDSSRFTPDVPPMEIEGLRGTVFLSVFEWRKRKGWDVLLRAWADAFPPEANVSLLLRTYPVSAPEAADRQAMIDERINTFLRDECGKARHDVAPIVAYTRTLSDAEVPALYTRCDVYVSPTRGEGWGRTFMEAMAAGRPVIATRWSAHLDFLTDDVARLIDVAAFVECDDPDMPVYSGQRWAEPSVPHLVQHLQELAQQPETRQSLGQASRDAMVQEWGWGKPTDIMVERLTTLRQLRNTIAERERTRRVPKHVPLVVDGALFTGQRRAPALEALLRAVATAVPHVWYQPARAHQQEDVKRPANWSPLFPLWLRRSRTLAERPARDVTLSILRRADKGLPSRPANSRWIVATGDVVITEVPAAVADTLRAADELWVPHDIAREACLQVGVAAECIHVIPEVAPPPDLLRISAGVRPAHGGTVIGLVVTTAADVPLADALVRQWERAFAKRNDVILRVMLGSAPAPAVREWFVQLLTRLVDVSGAPSVGPSIRARIQAWEHDVGDGDWPSMLQAMDLLITPQRAPAVPSLWALAASLGVPVLAPSSPEYDSWLAAGGGWAIPLVGAGRWHWPSVASAVDTMQDPTSRERVVSSARAVISTLPASNVLEAWVRSRLMSSSQ
jgi:glycosyltransferase involved in cell wall biosynthesis